MTAATPTLEGEGNSEQMPGTVMEFGLPADEFVLGETLARLDGVRFTIEPVVAHDGMGVMPYLQVSGTTHEELEAAFTADSTITAADCSGGFADEWMYHMQWTERVTALVDRLVGEGGTILAGVGADASWTLRVLFADRDALSRTHEECLDVGLSMEVERIYEMDGNADEQAGLTDKQQETLSLALEHGYYDIPRAKNAEELAGELGISHQAFSERLRRAHREIAGQTLRR